MTTPPRFRCISADPPWPERGGRNRGADSHYQVADVRDMPRIMQASPLWLPDSSCHLWLWATLMHLPDALWIMERLGFRYTTHLVWVKTKGKPVWLSGEGLNKTYASALRVSLGQYVRGSHELLLLGTRGKAMVPGPENRFPSVVVAPRGRHSAKPVEVVRRIEMVSPGPRAELFAREPRAGWWTWGNEIDGGTASPLA